ncbi:MAG TPA: hypothetical protein VIH92_00420, partial [Solirubrobacteraceae bacterium]
MSEDEKDQSQTEQTPTGHAVPVPKRDEFFANLKRSSRPQPKTPSPSAWNRKGSGRVQAPRGNSRGR